MNKEQFLEKVALMLCCIRRRPLSLHVEDMFFHGISYESIPFLLLENLWLGT